MNCKSVQQERESEGARACISLPVTKPGVFNHDATAPILQLLLDNPDTSFTNRELHRLTGKGMGNVNGAIRDLEALDLATVDRSGRANQVRISSTNVSIPDDPITAIPQSEFHEPVRQTVELITERIGEDAGIVLFGSIADGTADRASDIDLFVVVEDERMAAQREAHAIEDEIASQRFDGDRYEPHIVVETRQSAATHDRIREVLSGGLTLDETPPLEAVKAEVFSNGA